MTSTTVWRAVSRGRLLALALLGAALTAGCDGLLEVPDDPTRVEDQDLNDARGAQLLRRAALEWQSMAVAQGARWSGILADEFLKVWNPSLVDAEGRIDQRMSESYEDAFSSVIGQEGPAFSDWNAVRSQASLALEKLKAYAPPEVRGAYVGQMLALRGFAAMRLAEDICPGLPLHEAVEYKVVVSGPLLTEQALERALADFDSAVVYAADSARFLNFARVGRGRTLLNLGRFAEAAAAAADVPTGYRYEAEYSEGTEQSNWLSIPAFTEPGPSEIGVADREGGNGLNFASANDPRVDTVFVRMALDGTTRLYGVGKYPTMASPIVMAGGIEARLIEAEAALKANPGSGAWLATLNTLRTAGQDGSGNWTAGTGGVAGLAPLADPGTEAARVDLLFRERAFWLFGTGHRLGDMRRLVRVYNRSAESVFPKGAYRMGGSFGSATSIPFVPRFQTPFNPAVTGCTSR